MIILVGGSDTWRVEQDLARLRQHFIEKFDTAGINVTDLSLESGFAELLGAAQSLPFLSEKRFVIVRDTTGDEAVQEKITTLANQTAPSTILIFMGKESSEDLAPVHAILQTITHVPYRSHFYDQEKQINPADIASLAAHFGLRLSQSQIQELTVKNKGTYLHTLFAALKDAVSSGVVDENTWRAFVPKQEESQAFDFVDALMEKNPVKSFALAEGIVRAGSEMMPLWAMIYTQLRKYYALAKTDQFATTASEMGISFFEQNKIKKALASSGKEHIKRLYDTFAGYEREGKKAPAHFIAGLFALSDQTL